MRNCENNFNNQSEDRNTDWGSMDDNGFSQLGNEIAEVPLAEAIKRRQAERAAKRLEKLQKSERAKAIMQNVVLPLFLTATLAVGAVGAVIADARSTHGIMNTDHADKVEAIHVRSVDMVNGPKIRKNPGVGYQDDNLIIDSGEEGQRMHIPYGGTVYYFNDQIDPNGGWYGFPAEEFANTLFENGYISRKEADKLVKEEEKDDGVFWVNDGYVIPNIVEETENIG